MSSENRFQRLKICLQENQYIVPAFQQYGGFAGFQEYGILGQRIKAKLLEYWRKFFTAEEENIEEIETPIIIPYSILKASGHVDRFTDYVIYDNNNNCYRADHLAKKWFKENERFDLVEQVDSWNQETLEQKINEYKMLGSEQGYIKVQKKNLMYETFLNTNSEPDFLRPELAPGIFVNFKIIQSFLQRNLPFGICQIGSSFRKEISPQPFIRMRQFTQMEIEYFVDPLDKRHPLFDELKMTEIPILTASMQENNHKAKIISIKEAVQLQLISNSAMAYFLAKIYLFALNIGLKADKLRFRQHLKNELSHYALECWDLEVLVNGNWLECVGCADRGDYDMKTHSQNGKQNLMMKRLLNDPIIRNILKPKLDLKIIGQKYKQLTPRIVEYFNSLGQEGLGYIKNTLNTNDEILINLSNDMILLTSSLIKIEDEVEKITHEEFYPHVIEPSFGVDRILFAVFDHNFWIREIDEQRIVLSLPINLVPYDIAIFQLYKRDDMLSQVERIRKILQKSGFRCFVDYSNTQIGKRYARIDEMGIRYTITVDPETMKDQQATIRDRDTMLQIRKPIEQIIEHMKSMI